mmetsp:Transcript_20444/g.51546  ORF Transcript_20444/g.51546 Transcript_20444/m.51546 type:complete len:368 (-) Transcript_20444:553-1656(-)
MTDRCGGQLPRKEYRKFKGPKCIGLESSNCIYISAKENIFEFVHDMNKCSKPIRLAGDRRCVPALPPRLVDDDHWRSHTAAPTLVVEPQSISVDVATLHPSLTVCRRNRRASMQEPLVVEDQQISRLELQRHDVLLAVRELGEAPPSPVECLEALGAERWRILPTLGREAHALQRPLGPMALLELEVGCDMYERGAAVPAIVLEAHGHLAEQPVSFGVLLAQELRDVERIDHVIHNLAVAARCMTLWARAMVDGMEELEVGGRKAVRVVRVESDGLGGVRQVLLDALPCDLGGIRLRPDIEASTPISGSQSAQGLAESHHLAVFPGNSADECLPAREQLLNQREPHPLLMHDLFISKLWHGGLRSRP